LTPPTLLAVYFSFFFFSIARPRFLLRFSAENLILISSPRLRSKNGRYLSTFLFSNSPSLSRADFPFALHICLPDFPYFFFSPCPGWLPRPSVFSSHGLARGVLRGPSYLLFLLPLLCGSRYFTFLFYISDLAKPVRISEIPTLFEQGQLFTLLLMADFSARSSCQLPTHFL